MLRAIHHQPVKGHSEDLFSGSGEQPARNPVLYVSAWTPGEDADVSTGFTNLGGSGRFDIIVPAETHRQHINDHMLYCALINYHHTHSLTAGL